MVCTPAHVNRLLMFVGCRAVLGWALTPPTTVMLEDTTSVMLSLCMATGLSRSSSIVCAHSLGLGRLHNTIVVQAAEDS